MTRTRRTVRSLFALLAGLVSLALTLAAAPARAYVPLPTSPFTDVATSNPYYPAISWMYETGISTGWDDGTYRPKQQVDRDAMAAFIYRYKGSPAFTPPATSPFTDISSGIQFYKEMTWLEKEKITTGWPDGTYRPWTPTNRDAMAAFMYRVAGEPAYTPPAASPFTDVTTTTQFYKEMCWAAENGVAEVVNGKFDPWSVVTREMMASFMFGLAQGNTTLSVNTSSLPSGVVGANYSKTVVASGGTTPYAWTATNLPAGLSMSTTGVISGKPTAAGTTPVTVKVTDKNGATASRTLSLAVTAGVTITTSSLPQGTTGVDYGVDLLASGGTTPYTWTATGLPAGLTLNPDGWLHGTPTSNGGNPVFTVTDANGIKATKTLELWVNISTTANCDVQRCIAITFDDGPLQYSNDLVDAFYLANSKATFFMVGQNVKANQNATWWAYQAGMEVGPHGWQHLYYTQYGYSYIHYDFEAAGLAIESATGQWPNVMRPPYGYYNNNVTNAAGALGMANIMWTDNAWDYEYTNATYLRNDVVDLARRDSVILMHDGYAATKTAMPGIISDLKAQGYTLVTVEELLGYTPEPGVVYFDEDPILH